MSAILGGLFNSRLNMKLREEKGYTYGAGAGFDLRRGGRSVRCPGRRQHRGHGPGHPRHAHRADPHARDVRDRGRARRGPRLPHRRLPAAVRDGVGGRRGPVRARRPRPAGRRADRLPLAHRGASGSPTSRPPPSRTSTSSTRRSSSSATSTRSARPSRPRGSAASSSSPTTSSGRRARARGRRGRGRRADAIDDEAPVALDEDATSGPTAGAEDAVAARHGRRWRARTRSPGEVD